MADRSSSSFAPILVGGLFAGAADIWIAALINGNSVKRTLQVVASGLIGRRSYEDGMASAALGLGLQAGMSLLIAGIFVAASRVLPDLRRRWFFAGIAYGFVVFIVMNYVVVPNSAIGGVPHFTPVRLLENVLAMLLFGLIIAFFGAG